MATLRAIRKHSNADSMKHLIKAALAFFLGTSIAFSVSTCHSRNSQPESKAIAEEKNDEKFDSRAGEKEAQFVVDAISKSYAEVRLTEAAEQRAIDSEVRSVAINLNREHNALITGLKEYANKKAISYPFEPSKKDKGKIEKLMDEKHFDKAWCKQVHDINKETIDSFEAASTSLSDASLKTWILGALPEIRRSHDKIMACERRLE